MRDLDPRDVIEIEEADFDGAAGVVVAGGGQADAAERDGGVGRGRAVEGDRAAVAAAEVNRDAGHKLQELRDVALGDGAELIGGDDVFDVGGEALLVDRNGGAVHFA